MGEVAEASIIVLQGEAVTGVRRRETFCDWTRLTAASVLCLAASLPPESGLKKMWLKVTVAGSVN